MSLIKLVYASRPFGFDNLTLNLILAKSRFNNERDDVTGALICRYDIYLQLLEGPEPAVDAAFSRISRDVRHVDVDILLRHAVVSRLFPDWAMRDDPARSWMWTPQEIANGAARNAAPNEVLGIFRRVIAEPAEPTLQAKATHVSCLHAAN